MFRKMPIRQDASTKLLKLAQVTFTEQGREQNKHSRTNSVLPPHNHASFRKDFLPLNKIMKIFSHPPAYIINFKQFFLLASILHELLIWLQLVSLFFQANCPPPHFNKT